ncbi:hypothetical protein GCM10011297_13380 [Bacterioplanes sanyensis]|uniref:hypothetical protein n=1 Tax=Bacterioplanes sanyensis TaxID=1249553 RepID=UPI001679F504|nr:hypothetical protein [Bacterioplanes sanyensis]GGY41701.1 hypothetical protein GCM10011297_13380 [Bacterioplanes sanyensis]
MSDNSQNDHSLYVARLIENYLQAHPNAMDSFEGIRRWWITEQKIHESAFSVKDALEILVSKGVVEEVGGGFFKCAEKKTSARH